jgi:predicted RNase H-like HicB family nuclease
MRRKNATAVPINSAKLLKNRHSADGIKPASNLTKNHALEGRYMAALDAKNVKFNFETEREVDGRWIAEIADLPGVMAYGETKDEAMAHAAALALRVVADRIEEQKQTKESINFACA